MTKNFKGIYNEINEEVIKEKLKELYEEIVGTKRTGYSQCLVLWEDGTLDIHRLGQNESLQAEFKGECLTIYSEQEFDITDIEGWTEDDVEIFIDDNFYEWYENVLERIDENLEQWENKEGLTNNPL
jgi:hypothetical protein